MIISFPKSSEPSPDVLRLNHFSIVQPEFGMGLAEYDTTTDIGTCGEVPDLWNESHYQDRIIGTLQVDIFCGCPRFVGDPI